MKFALDNKGSPIISKTVKDAFIRKQAGYLYPNTYQYPHFGKYQNHYYTLQGANEGIDALSREYLVRYSRELYAQLPIIRTAVNVVSQFSVGSAYELQYKGKNEAWAKEALDWWNQEFSPNCCTRGKPWTFKKLLSLFSLLLDRDGDFLYVYGVRDGFPQIQVIPNDRIRSIGTDNQMIKEGELAGYLQSDGVVYDVEGRTIGYNIENRNNLVQSFSTTNPYDYTFIPADAARLVFEGEYIEKHRGLPSIASGVMQGLSIQELDNYLMDKIKLEACVALIEKTPSGEAPLEYQQTLQALQSAGQVAGLPVVPANTHAVEIQQGGNVRYIKSDGGDIKTLGSNTPANESAVYMERLEAQILSCYGVPHQMIYSTDKVSGRISDAMVGLFNETIRERQSTIDDQALFLVAWSMTHAMELGLIKPNKEENLFEAFQFTHPTPLSLNRGYDIQSDMNLHAISAKSLNDLSTKYSNKTASEVLQEIQKETIEFFKSAKAIAEQTGMDINLVIQSLKDNLKLVAPVQEQASNESKQ